MKQTFHGFGSVRFVLNHPLNQQRRFRGLFEYAKWQVFGRSFSGPYVCDFVDDARLIVRYGDYAGFVVCTGLFECEEMGFVLHALRCDDLFVDVGANVGAFTVLASKVVGARCAAFEPAPEIFDDLVANVRLNGIDDLVAMHNLGLGAEDGSASFVTGIGARSHVLSDKDGKEGTVRDVPIRRLDAMDLPGRADVLIKVDVEGYETEVIRGGQAVLADDRVLALIVELNCSGNRYGHDDEDTHRRVLDLGYQCYRYDPLRRELTPLGDRLNEQSMNTIYTRRPEELTERLGAAGRFHVHPTHTEV